MTAIMNKGAPMSSGTYGNLVAILDEIRKRQRRFSLLRGSALLICVLLGLSILLFLLDNLLHFSTAARWASLCAIIVPSAFILIKELVSPAMKRHSDEWFARRIEKEFPQLDNAVINALLLGRQEKAKGFVDALVEESFSRLRSFDVKSVIKWDIVRKLGIAAVAVLAAFLIYGIFFPSYFSNAFLRVFSPPSEISFISKTKISVSPGNTRVLRGSGLDITAVMAGELPKDAIVRYKLQGKGWKTGRMNGTGESFSFQIAALDKSVRYFVKAGDGASPRYEAAVISPPAIETFEFGCKYPEYTRLSERKIVQKTGDIEVLYGTGVEISGTTNNQMAEAKLLIAKQEYPFSISGKKVKGPNLSINKDLAYSLRLIDMDGYVSDGKQIGSVKAVSDKPPTIQVVLPGQNIIIGKFERIPILINVRDDYGVKKAAIKFRSGDEKEKEKVLKSSDFGGTAHAATLQTWISPQAMTLSSDDVLVYWIEAEDANNITGPGKSVSTFLTIRLVDPFVKLQESMRRLASADSLSPEQLKGVFSDLSAALKEVLRVQKEIRKGTVDKLPVYERRNLAIREQELRVRTIECRDNLLLLAAKAKGFYEVVQACTKYASQMDELKIPNLMSEAVKYIQDNVIFIAQGKEDEIIDKLELILKSMADLNRSWMSKNFAAKEKAARELIRELDRFMGSQKDVISVLERISKKPAEDYTPEDIKALQKLGEVEEGVRKDLSKGTNDFKNVTEKDLGASVVVNTLEEIIGFVKRAEGEFKKVTLTLDTQEMWKWIELGKQLRQDLEMWLMNKPDIIQWNVANPFEEYDVPMPDIPLDLQDYIADLIQTEDEMDDAMDNNITGGWVDNMSQAGWGIMDGPISNWSAKGKTGNMLPGNQELSGRSGEGRTGKSSGQFVEGKYKGLDGRKIPPRLSDERMQKGVVKEEKHKPTPGSTGGGKIGGWGAEGLTDNVPPQIKEELRRLALREAEIRAKATEVKQGLNPYLNVTSSLRQAITTMEDIEKDMNEGRYKSLLDKRKMLSEQLVALKEYVDEEVELLREPALRMDRNIRSKIVDALKEKYPDRYEQLVKEYFEVLSNELR